MAAIPKIENSTLQRVNIYGCKESDPLAAPASVKHYKAGETIYYEGEDCPYCYQLISGFVKEYNSLEDGGCQIIDFYIDRDVFGLSDVGSQLHTAEAITDCAVRCFPRDRFLSSIAQSPDSSSDFVSRLLTRLHRSQDRMVMLGRMTALQRLVSFLLRLDQEQGDTHHIELRMTRQDIADYLGLTIETVSRAFGQLKKNGWLKMKSARDLVITDEDALRDALFGCAHC